MSRPVLIAPSILPADFARLGEECLSLQEAGVDRIHWDIMDGVFVPNLTVGPDVVASIRPLLSIDFEAHLMVVDPDLLIPRYIEAGCSTILVHAEACTHLHRTLATIADLGATPAVALNPHTPPEAISQVRDLLGMVLVMTVNPGFGGQSYIAEMESKVTRIAEMLEGYDCDIEVDGGIGPSTIAAAANAGANVFVSGSALFKAPEGLTQATADLRQRAEEARS
jgi:ribulose-phosphate 3-epimerase